MWHSFTVDDEVGPLVVERDQDVHRRTLSYCVKHVSGRVYAEGSVPATPFDLDRWMKTLPQPWSAAMEATVFTGWTYDYFAARVVKKLERLEMDGLIHSDDGELRMTICPSGAIVPVRIG